MGLIKDATDSFTGGLLVMAGILLVGGILTLFVLQDDSYRRSQELEITSQE